jgi:hypothetical protein
LASRSRGFCILFQISSLSGVLSATLGYHTPIIGIRLQVVCFPTFSEKSKTTSEVSREKSPFIVIASTVIIVIVSARIIIIVKVSAAASTAVIIVIVIRSRIISVVVPSEIYPTSILSTR